MRARCDYTWKIFLNYVIIAIAVERKVHNFIQAFHRVDKLCAVRTHFSKQSKDQCKCKPNNMKREKKRMARPKKKMKRKKEREQENTIENGILSLCVF